MALLIVNVPTDVPPTTILAGATAKLMVGAVSALTVSVEVLVLVLLPSDVTRLPGETVTGYAPGAALLVWTDMVQLPIAGILPAMPRLIVAPEIDAEAEQPSTRPDIDKPGTLTEPPIDITAGEAFGLESVNVIVEFTPAFTLPGAKATVIVGVGAAVTVSVAVLLLALLPVGNDTRLPGTTFTGKLPVVLLSTGMLMVQVPIEAMVAMPNE